MRAKSATGRHRLASGAWSDNATTAESPGRGRPGSLHGIERRRSRPLHFFLALPDPAVYSRAFRLTFFDRRSENMTWTKPEIREIALNMEVTLYVTAR